MTEYYQLGGFAGSVSAHPKYASTLATKVYEALYEPKNTLELVLGIRRSGTSHLLLTTAQRNAIFASTHPKERVALNILNAKLAFTKEERDKLKEEREEFLRTLLVWDGADSASDFESLSPITFRAHDELAVKLDALQPRRSGKDAVAWDTSVQNRAYQDGESREGVPRGLFENSRVFYQVLRKQLEAGRCDLRDTSWTATVRVLAFCCNLWTRDRRTKVLDIGWCEAQVPDLDGESLEMSRHIVNRENQNLVNPGKEKYEWGESETYGVQKAAEELQRVFGGCTKPTQSPIVLLVHEEKTARDVLQSFDIDVSRWDSGLKRLLRPPVVIHRNEPLKSSGRRSASPRPQASSRRASPPPRSLYAPVYIVDVRSMFIALLETLNDSESVPAICRRLKLYPEAKGWCAGNECRMLVQAFRSMAEGMPINEQKKRWATGELQWNTNNDEVSEYAGSDSE
ncbi:hypothetical protein B0H10DRAFT_770103 [Mycena sp. CBHHK59/15]|nr:hypothetical protein B0H10DRAFT_770103 [Mycena sp. CBHHK59/15]